MLTSLKTAKEYSVKKIQELQGEVINATERALIESILEDTFMEKIEPKLSKEIQEKMKTASLEDLEQILFMEVPDYVTQLENTVAEVIAEYLPTKEVLELADLN